MSGKNTVNPGQYTQAGRLSPDDAARERGKQGASVASERSGSGQKAPVTASAIESPPVRNKKSASDCQRARTGRDLPMRRTASTFRR